MAFFSGLSSSIGKKLLLYGLRHIDILDKDPADFVNVDVGKRTTLEVRDVGLHIKKLIALLNLEFPNEIHLSSARASTLRVTFLLDFGVPQISIEIDGIQVKASLVEGSDNFTTPRDSVGQPSPPRRQKSPSPIRDDLSEASSNDDEHMPTVDELAQSFIRDEPADEIRELEQELEAKSTYLQDSVASSSDGEDEAGMGAPLALPVYLRNILNTALDRLSIVINHVDIEMEDTSSTDRATTSKPSQSSPICLNFHIERIAIDSVSSQDERVEADQNVTQSDGDPKLGKRRLQIQKICARLASDAENFWSMSRLSQPSSPSMTRSEVSSSHQAHSEPSSSVLQPETEPILSQSVGMKDSFQSATLPSSNVKDLEGNEASKELPALHVMEEPPKQHDSVREAEYPELSSSVHTADEDRFADALSDDGAEVGSHHAAQKDVLLSNSQMSVPTSGLGDSQMSYNDDGILDYALQHSMLNSRFDDVPDFEQYQEHVDTWNSNQLEQSRQSQASEPASEASSCSFPTVSALGRPLQPPHPESFEDSSSSTLPTVSALGRSFRPPPSEVASEGSMSTLPTVSALGRSFRPPPSEVASEGSMSTLPTVSALGRSFRPPSVPNSPELSLHQASHSSTDNLITAERLRENATSMSGDFDHPLAESPSSPGTNLAESQLFTHEDAESMYMSAVSAHSRASQSGHVPGGWDSSSTSSKTTSSGQSGSVPDNMISGSILAPLPEAEDGCETPRPGTPHSAPPRSPQTSRSTALPSDAKGQRQSKVFLTIDEIIIWFPLGLNEAQDSYDTTTSTMESTGLDFKPPNIGEDSIFAEMPGSFSNYAQSASHRRKPSLDDSVRRRQTPQAKQEAAGGESTKTKKSATPSIDIQIGSVASHMDVSSGRIMFAMFNHMLHALSKDETPDPRPGNQKSGEASIGQWISIKVSAKYISISWLENIMANSIVEGQGSTHMLDLNPSGAICRLNLSRVNLTSQSRGQEIRSKLQIGYLTISSLDQDIISFHKSRPSSRRSVGVLPPQLSNDVEIDYEQAAEKRITVVTQPVKVLFDIQKLDDALSSFGGFSGVLELSSSISSNNTVQSPVISPTQPRPRGVHFGAGIPPPAKAVNPSTPMPKIQVQFGEVGFTLRGRNCAVQLQTTSVRVVLREGGVRLKVSEVQLSGPYLDAKQKGAPLWVEVRGTTVNFLFTPLETDLTKLISMITPSNDPYENNDDILIDTLLRQRQKGSLLRVELNEVGVRVSDLQQMKVFEALGAELARLSKVTKYLPDDDRPGLLTLASIDKVNVGIAINENLGDISISLVKTYIAHVGMPALLAAEIGQAKVTRDDEVLVHEVIETRDQLPMIMLRMVGDEMEPVVKAKFFNLCVEYHVSTVMAALGISEDGTVDEIALGIASSVATITGTSSPKLSRQSSEVTSSPSTPAKPIQLDLLLRNCAIGLNPQKLQSKGLFVLTDTHIAGKQAKKDFSITVELRKASMHAIDDIARLEEGGSSVGMPGASFANRHLNELKHLGFVSLSSISAATVYVNIITGDGQDIPQVVDVEFKNELFVLESCADSTQTLIGILNGLQPPTPPSTAEKYRTVVPLQEMMESFTGDALLAPENAEADDFMSNADLVEDEVPTNLEFVGSVYNSQSLPTHEQMGDSLLGEDDLGALAMQSATRQRGERAVLESFQEKYEVEKSEDSFDFGDKYFEDSDSDGKGKARKWDSTKNQYHLSNEFKVPDAPLKVRVRDVNIIWNLYDGYDWPRTRGIITQAVDDVEARAEERRNKAKFDDEEDDFIEEDFLFNSVWIGVPVKDEKGALARRINHDIDDLASETGSYATSTATRSTGATARTHASAKPKRRLKLERSKHKKVAFSLQRVAVDLIVFPPSTGETINSIDVRVHNLEVFDHVPTSTWKKFVTCAVEPNARELDRPMVNLQLVTVKPVTDLAASELVIKVALLPLRLHVDQDALDFITRFFEFKDESAPGASPAAEQPFIQRLEVKAVTLKLDYKPKRVDYRGLRSGHTTEFMNFLILDGSDIVLRHAIVYGITSFDKLHKTLNDVWMPDVKRNQLPGVLSGLAAVRPLVNVGSGVRDLVVVPMREYKKDGRIVRSLQKGVYAFAKNTSSEVARLGAKVAIGTQNILEGAEAFLNPQTGLPSRASYHDWDGEDPGSDTEEPRAVSHYANQPLGVRAGLRSAARHLERDLLTARDAVIAIPAEVMEEGSGVGMAKALARHAPTVILRPALGATKALSNALLGVGNALDEGSRRKIEDKYKSY